MRAFLALVAAVFAAIGIGVGVVAGVTTSVTSSATKFAEASLNSVAAQPYLKLTTGLSVSGLSKSDDIVNQLSFDIEASSVDGSTPLSTVNIAHAGIEISITRNTTVLAEVRLIDASAVYLKADLAAIASLPGISKTDKSQIEEAAPLLGGRWFQLPPSTIASFVKALKSAEKAQASGQTSTVQQNKIEGQVIAAARKDGSASITPTANGEDDVHVKISVGPFVKDLLQIEANATSQLPRKLPNFDGLGFNNIKGTATGDLYANASTTVLDKTSASYVNGKTSISIQTIVTHAATSIIAPAGAIPLPKQIINSISKSFGNTKLPVTN